LTGRFGRWKNYYQFYPVNKGMYLIHGHHHGAKFYQNKQFNVNVDTSGFKPISESEIMNRIALEKGKNLKYKIIKYYKRFLTLFN
jgi:calcineurin-like phosphoesterase family protein